MAVIETQPGQRTDLKSPVRNRYFYGKLLDVYHFQLETHYFNAKRHLLNRLISGYGVVAGLDVQCGADPQQIILQPGLAIDKWGRELLVPETTAPIVIPADVVQDAIDHSPDAAPGQGQGQPPAAGGTVRVLLCHHECESDPTPVLAGDCGTVGECEPGTIRERYRVVFKAGAAPAPQLGCQISELLYGNQVDYQALTKWVSASAAEAAPDPCIPLANIDLTADGGHACDPDRIDITIRPIVYTNDLLFEIILALTKPATPDSRRAK
jgi:hypothetical protein